MIRTETWMSCKWMTTQFLCGSPNDGQHLEYRYNTVNNKDFQNDTGNWGLSSSIAGLIAGFVKEVPSPAAGLKRAKIVNDIEDSSSLIRRTK